MSSRPRVPCLEKGAELLARRSHFRRQLAGKLGQRGYPEEEVEAALDRLTELGYLDDGRTARELIEARVARGPEGRLRLKAELVRRGAAPEVAEEALDALLPEDELPAAREAAERWRRRGGTDPRSLGRHLERKGFSPRAVLAVLEEMGEAPVS